MSNYSAKIFKVSCVVAALLGGGNVFGAQAPNPRGGTTSTASAAARTDGRDVRRTSGVAGTTSSATTSGASRAATRRPTAAGSRGVTPMLKVSGATNAVSGRSATTTPRANNTSKTSTHTSVGRAASSAVVRSAVSTAAARSATNGASRASSARATAVFENISAIGGGYSTCRDAYASCMDQFCAKANDTYRRCFCSSKFTDFRDTEAALDQAKTLLMQFEDNNLNAVDKTAAEVNAMYTATVGEAAIKKDTSGAAKTLSQIDDLLSGKKTVSAENNSGSLGLISVDFSGDMDDIWSGGGSSIFDSSSSTDLSQLEGQKLYNQANSQCIQLITESCENDAALTMSRSAYNIMIAQDCNAYEKKIDSQKEAVKQTVRKAEKMLRDARLEEYRAHNSADVNECLDRVKTAITQDVACGANYKKCLDYSGIYIDINGEPIYTPRLFKLVEQINLDGSSDVLGQNPNFNKFLDDKKMFANTALDSCRDLADVVWTEFKRSALIEIAQAQDAKIEEVKMSCVSTMAECYDTQSNALKNFDKTTSQYSGAMAAQAARTMCVDKVSACAALYGNGADCKFDDAGRLTNATACGAAALVGFVGTVDNVRIAEGCATALENKLKDTCTPSSGNDHKYPWNCNSMSSTELQTMIIRYAKLYCDDTISSTSVDGLIGETGDVVKKAYANLIEELDMQLMDECEKVDGYWLDPSDDSGTLLTAFYKNVYGGNKNTGLGRCVENTVKVACENYNEEGRDKVATYNATRDECVFTEEWYQQRCTLLGNGYYDGGVCYVAQ